MKPQQLVEIGGLVAKHETPLAAKNMLKSGQEKPNQLDALMMKLVFQSEITESQVEACLLFFRVWVIYLMKCSTRNAEVYRFT